jgi:hypothetical protein
MLNLFERLREGVAAAMRGKTSDLSNLSDGELIKALSAPEWRCTACKQECVTIHDLECGGEDRHAACPLAPIDAAGNEIDFDEWMKSKHG